jgi:hypothetical protein
MLPREGGHRRWIEVVAGSPHIAEVELLVSERKRDGSLVTCEQKDRRWDDI